MKNGPIHFNITETLTGHHVIEKHRKAKPLEALVQMQTQTIQ